jgi:hypothetical protein
MTLFPLDPKKYRILDNNPYENLPGASPTMAEIGTLMDLAKRNGLGKKYEQDLEKHKQNDDVYEPCEQGCGEMLIVTIDRKIKCIRNSIWYAPAGEMTMKNIKPSPRG